MSALPSPAIHSRWWQMWDVASDLLIATTLIWTLPLVLGAVGALAAFLSGTK